MLKLYNTLTRKKEAFSPAKGNEARIYSCGPTIYDYAHIGNFRAYVFSDLLRRYLEYRGMKVRLVMNRGTGDHGITADDVEKSINYKIFWNTPNEKYPTVLSSLNQGIPISTFKPRSKLSASFRDLAEHLDRELYPQEESSGEGKKEKRGRRLFGRK